jgi:hypothetical protein
MKILRRESGSVEERSEPFPDNGRKLPGRFC